MYVVQVKYSEIKTAFLEACTGSSEALQCMCHTVVCIQTLRLYGQQKEKKSSIRLKYFSIHSCLTDVCFFAQNIERGLLSRLLHIKYYVKHTLLYSSSTHSVQIRELSVDPVKVTGHANGAL